MKKPARPKLSDPAALRADISALEGYEARLKAYELGSGWTYQLGCELTWARDMRRRAVHSLRRYERSLDV